MRWLVALLVAAGCGSGAVSGPPAPLAPLSVTPVSATLYPSQSTVFHVSGGNGSYEITSDNQAVVPPATVNANLFAVTPNSVSVDTPVNLIVRDSGTATAVTVPVIVRPIALAPLSAKPEVIAFQGVAAGTCASGIEADVIVSGGRPPYSISQPGVFDVRPAVVTSNPGRFTVRATGQCASSTQIAVVDVVGASALVTASNALSTAVVPTPTPPSPLATSPTTAILTGCTDTAQTLVVGGLGTYFAASGNDAVLVSRDPVSNIRFIMRRGPGTTAPATVPVAFTDGATVVSINVELLPGARGICP